MLCLRKCWSIRILFLLVFCSSIALAQPASEEEAKKVKIDSFIRVAQEQIRRGFYQQAQVQLVDLQNSADYSTYISPKQSQTIADLLDKIERAVRERKRISQMLQMSDELAADGNYRQAIQALEQIMDSEYATAQEKQMIMATYSDLAAKARQQEPSRMPEPKVVPETMTEETVEALIPLVEEPEPVETDVPEVTPEITIVVEQMPAAEQAELVPVTESVEEMIPVAEPVQVQEPVVVVTPKETVVVQPTQKAQDQYLGVIEGNRNRLRSYTQAIVQDSLEKAEKYLANNEFDMAKQALRRAFSTIEKNKMLLGDAQYKADNAQLSSLDQKIDEVQLVYNQQQAKSRQVDADKLTADIRKTMDTQRAEAIENYMDRTYAFMGEQRYEEALGQLEQLLAIDPLHQNALILKQNLEHTVRYIEQREVLKESQDEELKLLIETDRRAIPYASEINYPHNWKEISERREAAIAEGMSPVDVAVNMQLERQVDFSMLTEDTTFEEAIELLRNSVDPPLTIIVLWGDLSENAFIEKDTPINMSGEGLNNIILRTALSRLLQAVSSGGFSELDYILEDGVITIATRESLPTSYRTEVYDVTDLTNPPADFDEENQSDFSDNQGGGQGGGSGGGQGGGGGSSGGGGGGGRSGSSGGSSGGSSRGSSSGGGGGSSGDNGNWRQEENAYRLIDMIQQTIEPDSWYDAGGDGQIDLFQSKLVTWQTPGVHKQIEKLLEQLRADLGQQIAVEARFLLVDENFLENIGLDMDIYWNNHNEGEHWRGVDPATGDIADTIPIFQDSVSQASPSATSVSSSLGALAGNAFSTGFAFNSLDDLEVRFILQATQAHRNAKTLTAPKAVVLNGESTSLQVYTTRRIVGNVTLVSETTTNASTTDTDYFWEQELEDTFDGVRLSVTPVISADKKYVLMRISAALQELLTTTEAVTEGVVNSQVVSNTFDLPTYRSSTIQTRVTVPDQGTVLLGGLTLAAETEMESGTPILSKIPLLGRLFSNRSEVRDKQILLILVKPTIVLKDEAEADAMAALQY